MISCYFTEASHKLFEKGKAGWVPAEEGKPPKGKEGQDFEDAVVDEGSIETTLFVTAGNSHVCLLRCLVLALKPYHSRHCSVNV